MLFPGCFVTINLKAAFLRRSAGSTCSLNWNLMITLQLLWPLESAVWIESLDTGKKLLIAPKFFSLGDLLHSSPLKYMQQPFSLPPHFPICLNKTHIAHHILIRIQDSLVYCWLLLPARYVISTSCLVEELLTEVDACSNVPNKMEKLFFGM